MNIIKLMLTLFLFFFSIEIWRCFFNIFMSKLKQLEEKVEILEDKTDLLERKLRIEKSVRLAAEEVNNSDI